VNEGVLKGRTFEIHAPLAHVGRGAHNDVMIPDSSVSEMHAKLQRRDTGWVIVDMDSTNGTYVGGRRIVGEQTLTGSRDVRFGNVKCNFRVPKADQSALEAHGTRIIAPVGVPERVDTAPATPRYIPRTKAPSSEPSAPTPEPRRTLPAILWVTVLLAVAAGAVFIMSSR
jgi:predicted component of type VI protein secretion system